MVNQVNVEIDDNDRIIGRNWRCPCGARVESYMANDVDCDRCGRFFNGYGQELAPQELWEEN